MLRFLRKYSNSTGVKILYGLLAALFVVWGVGAIGGERVDAVARVHGQDITRRELDRATAALERRYAAMRIPPEVARQLDLRAQALDQLIDRALMRDDARRLGVQVSDAEVVDTITKLPDLQVEGRFNRELLEEFLRAQRDRGEFEAEIRAGLLTERLQALVTDGVGVTDAEVAERFRLDRDRVNLAFARLGAAELGKGVAPSDEELEKHLAAYGIRYTVPTRVRARYVVYRPADFAEQVTPTAGEVAEYYELRKEDTFTEVEQVRARHLLVKVAPDAEEATKAAARKKAEALLTKVRAGGDFAKIAREESEDLGSAQRDGDLGLFPRGRMVPEFESAAFALQAGQLSEVVETPFGFHVIRVEEHRPGGARSLEAVHDDIVQTLKRERGYERARKEAEGARRAVVNGTPFAEAVGGRPLTETPPFGAGDAVAGVGAVKAFTETALALDDGEVSDLIETDDAVYLLTPFARVEAHVPPLAEVRDRVAADARRARGEALAKERAEQLLARAREVGLAKAAPEVGLTVEETGLFDRRGGTIPKLGALPDLRTDALGLTPEAPLAPRVYVVSGDAVVASFRERVPADPAELPAAKGAIQDTLTQQKRQAALADYVKFLKERAAREGALEVRADTAARG